MTRSQRVTRSCIFVLGLVTALGLQGCGGRNNETKASADPKEIALVRVEPADAESAVPRNRKVVITFNETVLPESVDDQSIRIRFGPTFGTRPDGAFLVAGNIVEFDPTVLRNGGQNSAGFPAGEQILVEVPLQSPGSGEPDVGFVQNVEGNPVAIASGSNSITFTTGSGWDDPVPGPPGILGLEFIPKANTFNQGPSEAAVTVVFSEPIDPASVLLTVNIFLTNNSPTAPIFQEGIPSQTFFDGSLTRFTFKPVFGFGQGPFNIAVNFIDPLDPLNFDPINLPSDLVGNKIQNFTFLGTFDTQFDPTVENTGLIRERFVDDLQRDGNGTNAIWSDDAEIPFALVGRPILKRTQNVNIAAILANGGTTVIPNGVGPIPPPNPDLSLPNNNQGMGGPYPEGKYCPTVNPLVGGNLQQFLAPGSPSTALGRRRMNIYRQGELGEAGTIIRAAWGPDSDALFASTYPRVIVKMGHKQKNSSFAPGSMDPQFDVDGFVVLADQVDYRVIQAADVNGDGIKQTGYFDWPAFDRFFDYNGIDDLILDVEAEEGTTWQQFRTFIAASGGPPCDCRFLACIQSQSIGLRAMDSVFAGNQDEPANNPFGGFPNPGPFADVVQFEIATLLSIGTSLYYDSKEPDPTYLTPILVPLIQPGGSTLIMTYSGSQDGMVEDVSFTESISAINGNQHIRWRAEMRSNIFTNARPRIANLDIPFTFEFAGG